MENNIIGFDKKYNSEYYNKMYKTSQNYNVHYEKSVFFPIWKYIKERLDLINQPKILEIGCGVGDCAQYLYVNGYDNYTGFDFSDYAIDVAKLKSPQNFFVASAYGLKELNLKYNVVIATEVLEHLEHDIEMLNMINSGTTILASVPTRGGEGHARFFKSIDDVKKRYFEFEIIDYKYIYSNNKIKWIVFEAKK